MSASTQRSTAPRSILAALLGFWVCFWSSATVVAQPMPMVTSRAQAIRLLDHAQPASRAAALAWFGVKGLATDGDRLLPRLHDEDARVRELASQALWAMWTHSGNAQVDRLFKEGVRQMEQGAIAQALRTFTEVIRLKPDFVEGWNKRATVYFFAGEIEKSLADCDEVIKRNPNHFGALSGYGLIHSHRGDHQRALDFYRKALEVNPTMDGVRQNIQMLEKILEGRQGRST